MASEPIECLALHYSDGTFNVLLPNTDLAKAQDERVFADTHENDPRNLSNIVRVQITVLDVVEKNRP